MTAHRSSSRAPVRPLRAALIGGAVAALVMSAGAASADSESTPADQASADQAPAAEQVTDLGVAMASINVRLSAVGELADGTPVGYLFSDGNPVSLEVIDLRNGDLLDQHRIEGYTVASSIAVADDGTAYLSVRSPNDGTLWKYSPDSKELETIASGIAREEMLRMLDIDGDTLYGTTYPNANVYAVDLETEEVTEYGRIAPEGDYAWGLDADGGEVWVGAGTPAQLVELDPESGASEPIELPKGVAESGDFIQRVENYGDDLRVVSHRAVDGATAHVHDGTDWVGTVNASGMWSYTEGTADGAFYYIASGQDDPLWAYDVDSRTPESVDLSGTGIEGELGGTSQMFLAELGTAGFPGATVLGVRTDGQIWRYNLETGHGDVLPTDTEGAPVTTMSMAVGGDDQIYVGAYLSSGVMARIDPDTDEITQLSGPEQADAITAHGADTIVGTYPNAGVYRADADADWEWGTNPEQVLELGRDATGQDRPRHMISAGEHVAIGTIPNYGELGGGFTLLDPQTGDYEFHRNVVPDQSVTDLAYADSVVYGGTSIHGGLDSTPTAENAEVFAWHVDSGLQGSTAIPGAEIVHSLTTDATDATGALWAMVDTGDLVELDPATLEIVRTHDTGIVNTNVWGSSASLEPHPDNGLLYGNAGGSLFSVDPATGELSVLVDSGVRLATVADSDVFFADRTNVYRYALDAAAECDQEITGDHRGPLTIGEGTTCITDADVRGPVSVSDGASLIVEGTELNGPLQIHGAEDVTLTDTTNRGPVSITSSTGAVTLTGNTIHGPLACSGNVLEPTGADNVVRGPVSGQCAALVAG